MALAIGGNSVNKAYLGSTEIQKMYLGSELVFTLSDFSIISYNISEETNTTAKVQVYMTEQCSINYYVNGVKNAASSDDFDAGEIGPDEFRHTRTLTDLPAGQTSNLIVELTAESNLQVIQSDIIPLTTTGVVTGITPIMTNFRVEDANTDRVLFDTPLGYPDGIDETGFTIQGNTITGMTKVSDTEGHFTVGTSINYNETFTIRKESGDNSLMYDFTLQYIDNQVTDKSTYANTRFVKPDGNDSADGLTDGTAWATIEKGVESSPSNCIVNVKKGTYSGEVFTYDYSGTQGSQDNRKLIRGYNVTPGDAPSVTKTLNANLPIIDGLDRTSNTFMNIQKRNYVTFESLQITNYSTGIGGGGGDPGCNYLRFNNILLRDIGDINDNAASTMLLVNNAGFGDFNIIENSIAVDGTGSAFKMYGNNNMMDTNSSYLENNTGSQPSQDYSHVMEDAIGCVLKDLYTEKSATTNSSSHGVSLRSNTGVQEYNLIENCVSNAMKQGVELRHTGTRFNVVRGCEAIDTVGGGVTTTGLFFHNDPSYNIVENNFYKGTDEAIRFYHFTGEYGGSLGHNNTIKNNIADNCTVGIQVTADANGRVDPYDNKIYNNTFVNCGSMFFIKDTYTFGSTNILNGNIIDTIPTENGGAGTLSAAQEYNDYFGGYTAPSGEGNFSVNPDLNASYQPQATFTDIDVPKINNVFYGKNGGERQDPTTVGSVLSAEENSSEPPVTDYDFYVSATGTGDGLTSDTPMSFADSQTTINSMTSGQSIGYKGGDSFDGNLSVTNRTGITIGSYDTGKARISGLEDISGFINQGSNVWRATAPSTIYQVFKNDDRIAIGRYPANYSDSGALSNYYQVDTKVSTTSFTASELVGIPSLVGGSVTVLNAAWYSQTRTILTHNTGSGTITYDVMYEGQGAVGTGDLYCVQNHSSLNISQDNWSYNNGYLYIYSTTEPTNITIATNSGIGVAMSGCDNVALQNIEIKGFYSRGLELTNSNNLDISGCEIRNNYVYGIYDTGGIGSVIDNNIIDGTNQVALEILSTSTMINNTITDTAVIENLTATGIGSAIGAGTAVELYGGNIFRYNTIDRTGYNGIFPVDNASTIEFNKVSNSNLTLHDGAGIYAHYPGDGTRDATGTVINNNIVIGNGFGGQTWYAIGIYTDDRTHGITIENNTIIGTYYGYYMHNTKDHVVRYNNMYASINQVSYLQEDTIPNEGDGYMTGNTFTYNNLFSTNTSINQDLAMWIRSSWDTNLDFGTIDFNRYWNPYFSYCVGYSTNVRNNGAGYEPLKFDLPGWLSTGLGALEGFDANSEQDALSWTYPEADTKSQIVYNDTKTAATYPLSGTWYGMDGAEYIGSITLQPFTSEILINETPTPPNPNPELLTNGDFSNGSTGWNLFSGSTLNVDEITINTTGTYSNMLSQTSIVGLDNGSTYIVTGTISNYVSGQVRVWLGTNTYSCPRANGDFTAELIMDTADGIYYIKTGGDTTTDLTLDNLSLKLK